MALGFFHIFAFNLSEPSIGSAEFFIGLKIKDLNFLNS